MTKVYLVTGAPCSGKSTYVRLNMSKGDLVYDLDELAKALSYGELHNNNPLLIDYALDIRELILNKLEIEQDINAAWIITTNPKHILKANYFIDFEIVEMSTSEQECLKRLKEDPDGRDEKETKKVIKKYFKQS